MAKGVSVVLHPSKTEEGHDMEKIILRESSSENCINPLPASYTTTWRSKKETTLPQFKYWNITLQFELLILT